MVVKNPGPRPSSLAVEARSGRAYMQVLVMVLLSGGYGSRMKEPETRTSGLRTAARIEVVMVRGLTTIVGTLNHHGMSLAAATLTSWVAVKRRDIWAEATVLCEGWAKQLDTFAGVEVRKDLVQALCTLVVETLHDTCCCDLSEEPAVRSQVLV